MRGILVRVGIIAVIGVGAFILRPFVSGNAMDLNVGDCFDLPSASAETVKDVQHHPCDQDHGGEVIFKGDYPGSQSDTYPTENEMTAFLVEKCVPAYTSYAGLSIETETVYDIAWFQPTTEGWKKGNQGVTCYIYRLDEAPFKGSLKAG